MLCNAGVLPLDGGRSIEIEVHLTPALLKIQHIKRGKKSYKVCIKSCCKIGNSCIYIYCVTLQTRVSSSPLVLLILSSTITATVSSGNLVCIFLLPAQSRRPGLSLLEFS